MDLLTSCPSHNNQPVGALAPANAITEPTGGVGTVLKIFCTVVLNSPVVPSVLFIKTSSVFCEVPVLCLFEMNALDIEVVKLFTRSPVPSNVNPVAETSPVIWKVVALVN